METNYEETTPSILEKWREASMPDTRLEFPCRKIVFSIRSHDQGWGGRHCDKGTYEGSFTWFDVGLQRVKGWDGMRFDLEQVDPPFSSPEPESEQDDQRWQGDQLKHPFMPHSKTLQTNKTATGEFQDYEITLSWKDDVDPESEYAEEVLEKQLGRGKESMNGELVRGLRVGDVVDVWARARFPGWCNIVERVEIRVYWAV